jgi:hypothetical protein
MEKINVNKPQDPKCVQTSVSKSVFKYEIEKLDSGFLVNKMDIMLNDGYEKCGHNIKNRVGISNIDTLEIQMNKVISNHMELKDNLYFKANNKVIIKLSVEVLL